MAGFGYDRTYPPGGAPRIHGELLKLGFEIAEYRLTIDGRGVYSGFSLACALPPRTVMIDLQPSQSDTKHACSMRPAKQCRTWSNVKTFDENIAVWTAAGRS
jgi:hypothetical protein